MLELQYREAHHEESYLQKGQNSSALRFGMQPSFCVCYMQHYTQEALDG